MMISIEAPATNPVMTACGTKFTRLPSLSRPMTNMMPPTRSVIVNSARGIWASSMPATSITDAVESAIALVNVEIMRTEPVVNADASVATMPE